MATSSSSRGASRGASTSSSSKSSTSKSASTSPSQYAVGGSKQGQNVTSTVGATNVTSTKASQVSVPRPTPKGTGTTVIVSGRGRETYVNGQLQSIAQTGTSARTGGVGSPGFSLQQTQPQVTPQQNMTLAQQAVSAMRSGQMTSQQINQQLSQQVAIRDSLFMRQAQGPMQEGQRSEKINLAQAPPIQGPSKFEQLANTPYGASSKNLEGMQQTTYFGRYSQPYGGRVIYEAPPSPSKFQQFQSKFAEEHINQGLMKDTIPQIAKNLQTSVSGTYEKARRTLAETEQASLQSKGLPKLALEGSRGLTKVFLKTEKPVEFVSQMPSGFIKTFKEKPLESAGAGLVIGGLTAGVGVGLGTLGFTAAESSAAVGLSGAIASVPLYVIPKTQQIISSDKPGEVAGGAVYELSTFGAGMKTGSFVTTKGISLTKQLLTTPKGYQVEKVTGVGLNVERGMQKGMKPVEAKDILLQTERSMIKTKNQPKVVDQFLVNIKGTESKALGSDTLRLQQKAVTGRLNIREGTPSLSINKVETIGEPKTVLQQGIGKLLQEKPKANLFEWTSKSRKIAIKEYQKTMTEEVAIGEIVGSRLKYRGTKEIKTKVNVPASERTITTEMRRQLFSSGNKPEVTLSRFSGEGTAIKRPYKTKEITEMGYSPGKGKKQVIDLDRLARAYTGKQPKLGFFSRIKSRFRESITPRVDTVIPEARQIAIQKAKLESMPQITKVKSKPIISSKKVYRGGSFSQRVGGYVETIQIGSNAPTPPLFGMRVPKGTSYQPKISPPIGKEETISIRTSINKRESSQLPFEGLSFSKSSKQGQEMSLWQIQSTPQEQTPKLDVPQIVIPSQDIKPKQEQESGQSLWDIQITKQDTTTITPEILKTTPGLPWGNIPFGFQDKKRKKPKIFNPMKTSYSPTLVGLEILKPIKGSKSLEKGIFTGGLSLRPQIIVPIPKLNMYGRRKRKSK